MFTPILVLFAGGAGVTRRTAEEIAATLREEGLATEMRPLEAVPDLAGFGTVVLGAPFEAGRWGAEARAFLAAQKSALIQLPVAVFATVTAGETGAAVASDRDELLNELAQIRWLHPIAAGLFRTVAATRHGPERASGHTMSTNGSALPDLKEIRAWAQLVAHVLTPAPLH